MPLAYDDIPGSWGTYSLGWPRLVFSSKEETDRAFVACSRERVVPYGSYVCVGHEIRVETTELREALRQHLAKSPYKTAREVIDSIDKPKALEVEPWIDINTTG